jgi:hypothetical protein
VQSSFHPVSASIHAAPAAGMILTSVVELQNAAWIAALLEMLKIGCAQQVACRFRNWD